MWLAAGLLILLCFIGVSRDKSKLVPKGVLPNVVEVLVLFVRDEIAYKNIGKKEGDRYVAHLTTVFFFILFMNWLGLIPNFGSATGQLSVTMVLAVITFVLVQNETTASVSGHVNFWSGSGALLLSHPFTAAPRALVVLNTSALPGLAGTGGTVTVSHNGAYGSLTGKGVAVEPATGFTFDSAT